MAYPVEPKAEIGYTLNDPENNRRLFFSITESEEQTEAQVLAAKRSLITNIVLMDSFYSQIWPCLSSQKNIYRFM